MSKKIGIDTGGTFTDILMVDEKTAEFSRLKIPSTPARPSEAMIIGVQRILKESNAKPSEIHYLAGGSTVGTNTIIQRKGRPVGLLITKGFRDVLEIRRLNILDPVNVYGEKPVSLVPRRCIREINERVLTDGRIYKELNLEEVEKAVRELVEKEKVEAIAISFLYSFKNPTHEQRAKECIKKIFPELYICGSSEIWPRSGEYERTLVSVMNAYIGETSVSDIEYREKKFRDIGIECPCYNAKANGGITTFEAAKEKPIECVLSGPAEGVMATLYMSKLCGKEKTLAVDLGGTSCDVSVIQGEIPFSTEARIGEFPLFMPVVDVISVGAGGGSIIWVDKEGVLKVGPQSAGSSPGPVCYNRGGKKPTFTDIVVAANIINPDKFAGGDIKLYPDMANQSVEEVSRCLGISKEETIQSVFKIIIANLYSELLPLLALRGVDLSDFTLVAYGGAGSLIACYLAKELGIKEVLIPLHPGIFAALGNIVADIRADFVKEKLVSLDLAKQQEAEREIKSTIEELKNEALKWYQCQKLRFETYFNVICEMRYKHQSFEVPVVIGDLLDVASILRKFWNKYEATYHLRDEITPVEVVRFNAQIIGISPKVDFVKGELKEAKSERKSKEEKVVLEIDTKAKAKVYQRDELSVGDVINGLAVVEQYDTTILIPSGWRGEVDRWFNIIIKEKK